MGRIDLTPRKKSRRSASDARSFRPVFWYGPFMLALEAQEVIFLRMLKLASGGPQAYVEATRMIAEKAEAGAAAAARLLAGDSPHKITADYRRKVRANARRLRR
jgi:hypothetical protein